jgi:tRNA(Ile)-lysidine synthase
MDRDMIPFIKRLKAAGERQGWWNAAGLVVAVSGGGDSVAMLCLLHEFFPGRLVAAHLDHSTRNGASHDDAEFVQNLCKGIGITCHVKVVDVKKHKQTGESFEMAGRRERYAFFREAAASEGLQFIAVAHSADDLVETQLLNLFRGTGLDGLRGIPERRGDIVRPVIDFRRDELREILRKNGIPWREDGSNSDTKYRRNRVRCELIPWIKNNLNPNFEITMAGLAKQLSEELPKREADACLIIKQVSADIPPALACWKTKALKAVSLPQLKDMLRVQGKILGLPVLSRDRTNELVRLIQKGGCWRFQWSGDVEVCYSERGVGWLHRSDIVKNADGNKQNDQKDLLPWWAR